MPMEFINQNILLISVVVISAVGLLLQMKVAGAGSSANPAVATQLINRESAHVLDVRSAEEFANGHLPDARHIPLDKLGERIKEIEDWKEKPLIVCCASGMRSSKACGQLKKAGFANLYNLDGGVDAWVGAGYPLKKGRGK